MSLIKQLWLAIALLMLIAFGGSFLVSSISAKSYLEEQLALKNLDNANSLASVLGSMPKDPVEIGLLLSSQFDLGNYERIRLTGPRGEVIDEHISDALEPGAPAWFRRLLHIEVAPGWRRFRTAGSSSGHSRSQATRALHTPRCGQAAHGSSAGSSQHHCWPVWRARCCCA